jgi:cardiolipin synthase
MASNKISLWRRAKLRGHPENRYLHSRMVNNGYFNFANLLTTFRFLAAPIIVYCLHCHYDILAFWLFFIAGVTDWLDGLAARYYHQESLLGQLFDPLADKVLIISVSWALTVFHRLPWWLSFPIISRDILILIGSIIVWLKKLPLDLKPLFISKLNTCLQIIVCFSILAKVYISENSLWVKSFLNCLFYATLITTVLSGFAYAKLFYKSLRKL